MKAYMPHSAHKETTWLRLSSRQLEIEVRPALCIPIAERICNLCKEEIESKENLYKSST